MFNIKKIIKKKRTETLWDNIDLVAMEAIEDIAFYSKKPISQEQLDDLMDSGLIEDVADYVVDKLKAIGGVYPSEAA